jgi:DNA polymerase-1
MSQKKPRLYLIDGFSNIFRAFYAIRNLSSSSGEPTNAVFGFLQMLRKLLRDEEPEYLGVAFDVSSDTVRKDLYPEYKANRAAMPEDLRPQISWVRKVIQAYKIPLLELEKYEADDVLGTLAKKATAAGFEVVLVSPDKDLMQLVGNGVFMHHTGREKLYDAAGVTEDFGVLPEQVTDVLALMGDASDNVPGVPGIGEKGAKKLITEYGSLDRLLEHAAEVKRKSYREGLEGHRDLAELSKQLVTIHTDLPIDFDPIALKLEEPDFEALQEICWELNFTVLAKEYEESAGVVAEAVESAVEVGSAEDFLARTSSCRGEIAIAVVGEPEVLGLAVMIEGDPLFADFRHDGMPDAVRQRLRGWVGDGEVTLLGHDLKEVLRLLGRRGCQFWVTPSCRLFDTMLGSYLSRSELRSHDLDTVTQDRLHRPAMSLQDAGFIRGEVPMPGASQLLAFAGQRLEFPRRLAEGLRKDLEEEALDGVYEMFEAPLVPVLADIEETGIELDVEFLKEMSEELGTEMATVEEKIYEVAGENFNINSPQQLGEVMFEKLGYPVLRKTRKTKRYSTDAETLEELATRGLPLAKYLMRYRELSKLKSTYVDALPALLGEDGRLHTRFNQAVAATGRLSSAHPNLQNIPVRTELGQRIRKAFRAAPGMHLVVADYSQIELRILAHIAEEETMIEAFQKGEDIHATTAAAVLGISPLFVNPEQRRMAKTINFGIIYGISAWGLSRQLGITKKEAEEFITAYMERYPGVRRYTHRTVKEAEERGQVETLYGRIRRLPDIKSRNHSLRENAKRMAINARIQGTAADLLKLAMIRVDHLLRGAMPASRLLLTVHDELVFEAPETESEVLGEAVREAMEGVAALDVPLVVDVGRGPTWYEAKS